MANVVTQVIYITCSWRVFVFSILQSPHYVALIFRTCQLQTKNFCIRMAAVSAQHPGMGSCTGRADNTKEIPIKKIDWYRITVSPPRCPSFSFWGVKSGQEPSCASNWSYYQTSSNPPLQLCPQRCQPLPIILPSPSCLPACFSPSSLPGCPSPGARPPLLPSTGQPQVSRHPLGAGHRQEPG